MQYLWVLAGSFAGRLGWRRWLRVSIPCLCGQAGQTIVFLSELKMGCKKHTSISLEPNNLHSFGFLANFTPPPSSTNSGCNNPTSGVTSNSGKVSFSKLLVFTAPPCSTFSGCSNNHLDTKSCNILLTLFNPPLVPIPIRLQPSPQIACLFARYEFE